MLAKLEQKHVSLILAMKFITKCFPMTHCNSSRKSKTDIKQQTSKQIKNAH